MRFISYTQNDKYYEFLCEDGTKVLMPFSQVIIIDDNSGAITVKSIGSRSTIGYIMQ